MLSAPEGQREIIQRGVGRCERLEAGTRRLDHLTLVQILNREL